MKSFAKGISEFGFFIIVTVVIRSGVGWERRKLMRKTIGRVLLMGSLAAGGTDVIFWQLIDDQRIVFWWWSKNKTLDDGEIKLIRRWSKNVAIKYGRMTSTAAMSETSIFNQMRGDMFRLEAETTAFAWEFHPSAYTLFCNLFAGKSKSNSCRIIFARFLRVLLYVLTSTESPYAHTDELFNLQLFLPFFLVVSRISFII